MTAAALITPGSIIAFAALLVSVVVAITARRTFRINTRSEARNEAVELADVRGKVIQDLESRVETLENEQKREREDHAHKIELLEKVIRTVRDEAAEAQRMLVVGFRGAALKILGHLEAEPAEVDQAVDYLRDMLNSDPPRPTPLRHRKAA